MNTRKALIGGLIAAAVLGGARYGITGESPIRFAAMGRYAASLSLVPGGSTVRIRIAETGSVPNCRIVVAQLSEGRVKAYVPGSGSSILREWTLREATSQPVLVHQMTNSSYIGIGVLGAYTQPQEQAREGADFQTFVFPSITDRMTLDVKVVEPEF